MTECNRCGDCCEKIFLAYSKKDLKQIGKVNLDIDILKDVTFILKHWRRINKKNSSAWLKERYSYTSTKYLYSCDMFDAKTRMCMAHEDRPPVCSNFPWYGGEPKARSLSKNCSFLADIPVSIGRTG